MDHLTRPRLAWLFTLGRHLDVARRKETENARRECPTPNKVLSDQYWNRK